MKQHKWHKEICAWAAGAEIESKYDDMEWITDSSPDWMIHLPFQYRIKPQPKEPQYLYVYQGQDGNTDVSLDGNCPFKYWTLKGKIKLESNDE